MPAVVKAKVRLETDGRSGGRILRNLERFGRVCYRSEDKITRGSAEAFVRMLIKRGHYSVIEHEKITARVVCDRGVSHEIVRHRIGSYSQESTRYCDYATPGGVTVVDPSFFPTGSAERRIWFDAMKAAETAYRRLRELGASPQQARLVLSNSTKTELIVTFNLREWRHFIHLRCGAAAHPQMREIAIMLLEAMQAYVAVVFEDFRIDRNKMTARTDINPAS
jgi:thymidylate synthase (FAD)